MNKKYSFDRQAALDAYSPLRRRLLGSALIASTTPLLLSACGSSGSDSSPPNSESPGLGSSGGDGSSAFTVQDRKIMRNGEEFFAKGVCYSPVPIGAWAGAAPGGDHFSDFWEPLFNRDMGTLAGMGCNSIRLYMTSPWETPWDPNSNRQYHTKFMDACAVHGIYVWVAYPMTPEQAMNTNDRKRIETGFQLLCEEMGKHESIIGFTIGNELDTFGIDKGVEFGNATQADFWNWINTLAGKVKGWAPDKLVSTSLHDIPRVIELMVDPAVGKGVPNLDVISLNSYRGTQSTGFDTMFTDYDAKFKNAGLPDRPFLVTEFGCPASTRQGSTPVELPDHAKAQADYIEAHWKDIEKHHGLNLCSGGYVFSWADEWWKIGNITTQEGHSSCDVTQFPGGCPDEEWYGINSIGVGKKNDGTPRDPADPVTKENVDGKDVYVHHPDILTPRAAIERLSTLWKA
ncbi:hypothetical protein [Pusillimonas noertemannii]|uniref:Glucanosyltransferase n=1 Tax=Pusillimonas noertemannii TaxID=305977 RepID=A0A2U1CLK2_9BURK|nr:hypothetical protein [Pusillimonas noertemannii]NYT69432.1 hypothetical protein [Pusillimonas noertemannii]PVY61899.1 glucanosyltransferase [Pusillimonas noertemannii]TFL09820.1 hypothetical protein CSC72_13240 [Pusillimonas noertemannii]